MKNLKLLLLLALFSYQESLAQAVWNSESFESETRYLSAKGSVVNQNGIWIDGGSYVSIKETEYALDGTKAAILTAGPSDPEKPFYGSIYTQPLDLTSSGIVDLDFDYFLYDKEGTGETTGFTVEALESTGEFSTIATIFIDGLCSDGQISDNELNTSKCVVQDPKDFCNEYSIPNSVGERTCIADIADYRADFWYHATVGIPDRVYLESSVIRIKAIFSEAPTLEAFIDNVAISYSGAVAPSVNIITPESTLSTLSGKELFNVEGFETEENAAWGIWRDGGADAYRTLTNAKPSDEELIYLQELLDGTNSDCAAEDPDKDCIEGKYDAAVDGEYSIAIRDYYDFEYLEDIDDEYSGEKATYSAILTDNLDFTDFEELELHFSFVAVGMEYEPEPDIIKNGAPDDTADSFTLSISRDAGITFTDVKTWVAGVDFVNDIRYNDVSTVVNYADFEDLTGTPYDFDGFTTTTILKLTAEADDDTDIVYMDDITIYTVGSSGIDYGADTNPEWTTLDYSVLNSDGGVAGTYDLINAAFHPEGFTDYEVRLDLSGQFGAVEHSDCSHEDYPDIPNGITEEFDADLGQNVFSFNMDLEADTDRCKNTDSLAVFDQVIDEGETEYHPYKNQSVMYDVRLANGTLGDLVGDGDIPDRQRIEFKTYSLSNDFQIAELGETHVYAWKFKLPADFAATDRFTHLHQLKSRGAIKTDELDEEGKPLITLTAGGPKTNQEEIDAGETDEPFTITTEAQMRLRYSPADQSQINLMVVPLEPFLGKWVQCIEKITVGEWGEGRYELLITDVLTGEEIMNFKSNTLRMYKTEAEFMRAKWGIYRSLIEADKMKDEQVKFADIIVVEANDANASLTDFASSMHLLESEIVEEISPELAEVRELYENPEGYPNFLMMAAHRGYWRNVPENSLAAFQAALDIGIEMIELDLKMTADGEIIMLHDLALGRVTNLPSALENAAFKDDTYDQYLVEKMKLCDIRPDLDRCLDCTDCKTSGIDNTEPVRNVDIAGVEGDVLPTLEETFELLKDDPDDPDKPAVLINIDKIQIGADDQTPTYFFDSLYAVALEMGMLPQIIVKQGVGKVTTTDLRASDVVDWSRWYYTPTAFPDNTCADGGTLKDCLVDYFENPGIVEPTDRFNATGAEFIYMTESDREGEVYEYIVEQNNRVIQFPQYPENAEGTFQPGLYQFGDVDARLDRRNDWSWLLESDKKPQLIISDRLEALLELLENLGLRSK